MSRKFQGKNKDLDKRYDVFYKGEYITFLSLPSAHYFQKQKGLKNAVRVRTIKK